MRLFAALPIPDPARSAIIAYLDRLRRTDWPVRWVKPEGIHLTLKFYGEVVPERLDVIEEALRFAVVGTGPIPLRITELGAFPTASRPRVLWIGVDAPPALELLQDRLERGGEEIGFPPEGVPFNPHVTLGRVREGHRLPPGSLHAYPAPADTQSVLVDQLVLYESVLTSDGPRYQSKLALSLQS
jgi:RNA 2',3'-cyclic 3'-phosphodiesterase